MKKTFKSNHSDESLQTIGSPLVSVVIASYQHEFFIIDAIKSILDQTFQDFEIIITDDGSSDKSVEKIKTINDKRISLFEFKENQGASAAANNSIINAQGKYIAIMNSDDVWTERKLEKQVDFLEKNKSVHAVFSSAELYDESLKEFSDDKKPYCFDIFNQKNRSSGEWLKKFFYEGNCLCHPSILIRRECYDELGLYDNRFRQLPDFDMWIKFCKKYQLHVLPDKFVKFRLLSNDKNASSPSPVNQIRGRNEYHLIMQSFFDGISIQTFKEGFGDRIRNKNISTNEELEIEIALLYLNTPHSIIGIEKLYKLLRKDNFSNLLKIYKITDKEFHQITSQHNSFSYTIKSALIKDAMLQVWTYPKVKLIKIVFRHIINILKTKSKKYLK